MRRKNPRPITLCVSTLVLCTISTTDFAAAADRATYTSFDPAGSIATEAIDINNGGSIAGDYIDSSNLRHGFVRAEDGTITSFDAGSSGTFVDGMNNKGAVVGGYDDSGWNSFVRTPDGTIKTFKYEAFTAAHAINDNGQITGEASGGETTWGFVRNRDGDYVAFDPSGAMTCVPVSINKDGSVTGNYTTFGNNRKHGFVRTADGTITVFDPPGSTDTFPKSINDDGVIAGYYRHSNGMHGFTRAVDGTITTFDVRGTDKTRALAVSDRGMIVGTAGRKKGSFLRSASGRITRFGFPGAAATAAVGISRSNSAAGSYVDSSGLEHGFVRTPQ